MTRTGVALTDADGLSNPGDTEYFIRTLEDRPSDVRIVRPAADRRVTLLEEVPIEARADDDFGVASLELVYAVRGAAEVVVPFERGGVRHDRQWPADHVPRRPGRAARRLRELLRTRQGASARAGGRARGGATSFSSKSPPSTPEFASSEGARAEEDSSLADLIGVQKEIITATWTLDRRGRDTGRRSVDGIRAIANAQRDLRERTLAVRRQMQRSPDVRRRQAEGRRQAALVQQAADALQAAVWAMGQAQEKLDAGDTTGALPHEMAALNELLHAQAENRRREIGQQASVTRDGQNRPDQDLSAIFDRELARQQQTMFETPTSREADPDATGESETADRLGELARGQDDLNRQQQELAKSADEVQQNELRRQLQRLTREQSELRRQAEELARQLQGDPSGRDGQGEVRQPNRQQAGRELQQIAEEMQEVSNELRRANPQLASERGSRVADRLRDLEQRMRGTAPDDHRRALGELQLESRQLADGQRRLSDQPEPEPGSVASGRRAAEQGRLADRAERLEQAVQRLAETAGTGDQRERESLEAAAREIEGQPPSQRMRSAASQERAATGPEGEEIARMLDRLADRLAEAGGQSDEALRLTEELASLRELREQLAMLDRQLEELREQEDEASAAGEAGGTRPSSQSGDARQPWEQALQLLEQLRQERGLEASPAASEFNPGRSAPGTEAWKQDFARWDDLKVQVAAALERAEQTAAARLRDQQSNDRLNAGASQNVPEQYRRLVERYFRALASGR